MKSRRQVFSQKCRELCKSETACVKHVRTGFHAFLQFQNNHDIELTVKLNDDAQLLVYGPLEIWSNSQLLDS